MLSILVDNSHNHGLHHKNVRRRHAVHYPNRTAAMSVYDRPVYCFEKCCVQTKSTSCDGLMNGLNGCGCSNYCCCDVMNCVSCDGCCCDANCCVLWVAFPFSPSMDFLSAIFYFISVVRLLQASHWPFNHVYYLFTIYHVSARKNRPFPYKGYRSVLRQFISRIWSQILWSQ